MIVWKGWVLYARTARCRSGSRGKNSELTPCFALSRFLRRASSRSQGCERDELPNIPDDDPMWDAVAHTLGGLCASLVLVVSPERIILSGGVMNRTSLYPKVCVGWACVRMECVCACLFVGGAPLGVHMCLGSCLCFASLPRPWSVATVLGCDGLIICTLRPCMMLSAPPPSPPPPACLRKR